MSFSLSLATREIFENFTRSQAQRETARSAKRLYSILIRYFFDMQGARLDARRADYINAATSSSASGMYTSVFNTRNFPHIDLLREADKICQHEWDQLNFWIDKKGHVSRPKTPFLDAIEKASKWLDVGPRAMYHEVQAQARGNFMPSNGACKLILEGRFPELAVKMEQDERDMDLEFWWKKSLKLDEQRAMKKIREDWKGSL
ncbi:MAG: hypothetical protein Q9214_005552 [Letrouitia sp. 1 TL-2023]